MRLVADANVFVSAALGRSGEARSVRIITAALDGRIELVMSPRLLAEVAEVLSRPRIRKRLSAEDAQLFLADIAAQVVMFADRATPRASAAIRTTTTWLPSPKPPPTTCL